MNFMREGGRIDTQKPFKKVGTHHGRFHADEVMATAILREIFDVEVVRTRNPEMLNELEIVYDVGGGEFDHHQVDKTYRHDGTPYAACGLIWNRYGKDVIISRENSLSEDDVEWVFRYVDTALIKGIDAVDNGIKTSEVLIPTMNISSIISGFNPPWDSEMSEDIAFDNAVNFASTILDNALKQKFSTVKARENIVAAYEKRPMPEVLVLEMFYPWVRMLQEVDEKKQVLFVVYPSREGYILHTVREDNKTFRNRKNLPKVWAGKRDEELDAIVGIDDAVFCHTGRFIAGAGSFESIMKMAKAAVAEPPDKFTHRFFAVLRNIISRKH